jgi:Na+-transporting methylmalonyl-CoA/oxaloacetate decarboxylase beta subunit
MAIPDKRYSPALPEVTERVWFVSGQTAEIVAPATAAALWSVIVPVISPVVICAESETAERRIRMRAQ